MSRSYQKNCYFSYCSTNGQKQYRSQENRAKRRKIRTVLQKYAVNSGIEEFKGSEIDTFNLDRHLPQEKQYGNEWCSPRDGKRYWPRPDKDLKDFSHHGRPDIKYNWLHEWLRLMRK